MMASVKLSKQQLTAMRFLARSFPIVWIPYELESFSPEYPELVTAKKTVPALRSLHAAGYARPFPKLGKWACVMTVEGMRAFEIATNQAGLVEKARGAWVQDELANGRTANEALKSWSESPGMANSPK